MAEQARTRQFIDPGEALGEVMFGLIMVLTFTLGARLLAADETLNSGELIAATVGCNVAWGIIDAVLFVFGSLFDRGRRAQFFRRLRTLPEPDAMAAIGAEFGLEDEPLAVRAEDRIALYRSIHDLAAHAEPVRVRVRRDDLMAAVAVFVLVSATSLPGVLPFLLIENDAMALRISNLILVLLLFGTGFWWAHYTNVSPWRGGISVMLLGVMMVAIAIALGG